jgi:hypothetical protein
LRNMRRPKTATRRLRQKALRRCIPAKQGHRRKRDPIRSGECDVPIPIDTRLDPAEAPGRSAGRSERRSIQAGRRLVEETFWPCQIEAIQ